EMCGGEISRLEIAGEPPISALDIAFDDDLIEKLTGLAVKPADAKRILGDLGFEVSDKGGKLDVKVPTWRPDVHGPADLVEEVIRIVGIDTVPSVALPSLEGVARPVMTPRQVRMRRARRALAARGLVEAVTWSFISPSIAAHFGGGAESLTVANPISADLSVMRPSLLPGLIEAARRNVDRGLGDSAMFEVGQVYLDDTPEGQKTAVAGVRVGHAVRPGAERHWSGSASPVTAFDAKADAAAALAAAGLDPAKVQVARSSVDHFHPGRAGTFQLGPKNQICHFGVVHPSVTSALDIDRDVVAFELILEAIPDAKRKSVSRPALELADLQPVRRDFAFVVDEDVAAGDLVRAAQGAEKKLITGVELFDVFDGAGVGEGKKSLAIEVTLQPTGAPLTDDAIDAVSKKVVAQVKKAVGGEIRGS
ncbi:MAG: phenylalanine--tRNA ligase subunit beta, partial [Pseudomonadota bacterium]